MWYINLVFFPTKTMGIITIHFWHIFLCGKIRPLVCRQLGVVLVLLTKGTVDHSPVMSIIDELCYWYPRGNQLYVEIMSDVVLDIDDSSFLLSALDLQIDHSILFLKVQTCKDLINDLSSPKFIKPMWL